MHQDGYTFERVLVDEAIDMRIEYSGVKRGESFRSWEAARMFRRALRAKNNHFLPQYVYTQLACFSGVLFPWGP
jgi:hypothetical protein